MLLFPDEVGSDGEIRLCDRRADHLRRILHACPGQIVRAGIVNGPTGIAVVLAVTLETVTLRFEADPGPGTAEPPVDLLIGMPRPKVLKRLWSQLAALGIDRIFPVQAERCEKFYSATQWIDPAHARPLLIEGAEQAGVTRLPCVAPFARLGARLTDSFLSAYPPEGRWMGDPGPPCVLPRFPGKKRLLLAVGPERGWSDSERERLCAAGFQAVRLGPRMLRSDTACVALAAMAMHRGMLEPQTS